MSSPLGYASVLQFLSLFILIQSQRTCEHVLFIHLFNEYLLNTFHMHIVIGIVDLKIRKILKCTKIKFMISL